MSAFCAICADDIVGEPLRRPLGKGDALVNVCTRCDEEHPAYGGYAFNGSGSADKHLGLTRLGAGNRKVGAAR